MNVNVNILTNSEDQKERLESLESTDEFTTREFRILVKSLLKSCVIYYILGPYLFIFIFELATDWTSRTLDILLNIADQAHKYQLLTYQKSFHVFD